jgi:hypothetical protein
VVDVCQGAGAGAPAHAVASGFTDMGTTTFSDQAGRGVRVSIYNKILTNADIGATFQGVVPGSPEIGRKMVCTYRMSRPIQTVSYVAGWGMANTTGGSFAVGPTTGYTGPTILHGATCGDTLAMVPYTNSNWNGVVPAGTQYLVPSNIYGTDATGPGAGAGGSQTLCFYSFYPKGATPQAVGQVNVSDTGEFTYSALLVLQLT